MRINVTSGGVGVSSVVQESVVRRVLLGLSRFGPRVRTVTVLLTHPANPMGGVDQACTLRARLQLGGDVHAKAINGVSDTAVARAISQLAKRVDTALLDGPRAAVKVPPHRTGPSTRRRVRHA